MTTNLIYRAAREPEFIEAFDTLAAALGIKIDWLYGYNPFIPKRREWKQADTVQRCQMLGKWLNGECYAVIKSAERPVEFVNLGGTND